MSTLLITDGPSLPVMELLWEKGHKVFVFLCRGDKIVATVENLLWDNSPRQRRAIIDGKILCADGQEKEFSGTFNGVGAGLFELAGEPVLVG